MNNDEIIEKLATAVMGWTRKQYQSTAGNFWGVWVISTDYCFGAKADWNPLTNPADSKMVREKLEERFVKNGDYYLCLVTFDDSVEFSINDRGSGDRPYEADADTEEMAVAKAALLTVGVKV